jgi:hypothetical protein
MARTVCAPVHIAALFRDDTERCDQTAKDREEPFSRDRTAGLVHYVPLSLLRVIVRLANVLIQNSAF